MRIKNEETRPNSFRVTIGKKKNQSINLEHGWNEEEYLIKQAGTPCSGSAILAALQANEYFAGLVKSDKIIVQEGKQEAKELAAKLKAESEARKAEEEAKKKAEAEAAKEEEKAIKSIKDSIVELGMERKSLNGKNLKALESIYENLKKAAQ